jgi:Yqey-like protein
MSARDTIAVAALRSAMSALDNAEAVDRSHAPPPTSVIGDVRRGVGAAEVSRRELSEQDAVEIVRAEVTERTAAASEYERLGRAEQATRLRAEAAALLTFLETATETPLVPGRRLNGVGFDVVDETDQTFEVRLLVVVHRHV